MKKSLLFILFMALSSQTEAQVKAFDFYLQQEMNDTVLILTSVETFPCAGYGIQTFQFWYEDTFIVDIRGFKNPTPCYSSMDPAQEKILISPLRTKKFYIKFRWEEVKDKKYEDKWMVEEKREAYKATPLVNTFSGYSK